MCLICSSLICCFNFLNCLARASLAEAGIASSAWPARASSPCLEQRQLSEASNNRSTLFFSTFDLVLLSSIWFEQIQRITVRSVEREIIICLSVEQVAVRSFLQLFFQTKNATIYSWIQDQNPPDTTAVSFTSVYHGT